MGLTVDFKVPGFYKSWENFVFFLKAFDSLTTDVFNSFNLPLIRFTQGIAVGHSAIF